MWNFFKNFKNVLITTFSAVKNWQPVKRFWFANNFTSPTCSGLTFDRNHTSVTINWTTKRKFFSWWTLLFVHSLGLSSVVRFFKRRWFWPLTSVWELQWVKEYEKEIFLLVNAIWKCTYHWNSFWNLVLTSKSRAFRLKRANFGRYFYT